MMDYRFVSYFCGGVAKKGPSLAQFYHYLARGNGDNTDGVGEGQEKPLKHRNSSTINVERRKFSFQKGKPILIFMGIVAFGSLLQDHKRWADPDDRATIQVGSYQISSRAIWSPYPEQER